MRAPEEYDELAVAIVPANSSRQANGDAVARRRYEARILWSPYDGGSELYEPPFDVEEVAHLLDTVCEEVRGRAVREHEGPMLKAVKTAENLSAREVGERLFETLFKGRIQRIFDRSLSTIAALPRKGLRLRLVFDPRDPEVQHLAVLPWELLRSEETLDDFSLMVRTPIIRHLQVSKLNIALPIKPPLRVLVAAPSPSTQEKLDLAEEVRGIEDAWGGRHVIEVTWLEPATIDSLCETMAHKTFDILHFMGHAKYDSFYGVGRLLFEYGHDQEAGLSGEELARYLKDSLPRLVVLNSCNTAKAPFGANHNHYTGVATALVAAGVTAVVANQFPISNRAAIAFSSAFYKSLAVGEPVDAAVVEGRLGIVRNRPSSFEWVTPVLFMRSRDGKIFEFTEDPEQVRKAREIGMRLGLRSFSNHMEDMEEAIQPAENLKDFLPFFDERELRQEFDWQETILPAVRDFLLERTHRVGNVYLYMDAHWSIAFAAGYVLNSQCSFGITLKQRTSLGNEDWRKPDRDLLPSDPMWTVDQGRDAERGGGDVAVAISVTHDIVEDVREYVRRDLPSVGRILVAQLSPRPNLTGLRSATHAFHLALKLVDVIRQRSAKERKGTLHLFSSAPNGFVFFLGQHARAFGKTVLYEHDLESGKLGAYSPSLTFPPPVEKTTGE